MWSVYKSAVDDDVNLLNVWVSDPDRDTVFSCREFQSLSGNPWRFGRSSPGCTSEKTDELDSIDVILPPTSSRCLESTSIAHARRHSRFIHANV